MMRTVFSQNCDLLKSKYAVRASHCSFPWCYHFCGPDCNCLENALCLAFFITSHIPLILSCTISLYIFSCSLCNIYLTDPELGGQMWLHPFMRIVSVQGLWLHQNLLVKVPSSCRLQHSSWLHCNPLSVCFDIFSFDFHIWTDLGC
jgi:hypothetical protein